MTGPRLVALTLAAALAWSALGGCTARFNRSGSEPEPPIQQDASAWLSLCNAVVQEWDDPGLITASREVRHLVQWLETYGTARLKAEVFDEGNRGFHFNLIVLANRFVDLGVAPESRWEAETSSPDLRSAAVLLTLEDSGVPVQGADIPVLQLKYQRVEGEWLLDALPELYRHPAGLRLPVAPHVSPGGERPETSPILHVRCFPPAEVPAAIRETYAELGIALPADEKWQDVTWKGQLMSYPGCDTLGLVDPIVAGRPDELWKLQATAADEWLPYFYYEMDSALGRELPINPVTLRVDRDADAELLVRVLQVLARRGVLIRAVSMDVLASPDGLAPRFLELRQPLGWDSQQSAPIFDSSITLEELGDRFAADVPGRAGVVPVEGATAQDVVTALDNLRGIGVDELFVAVLPEGYESLR